MDYVALSEDLLADIGQALDESANDQSGLPLVATADPLWKAQISGEWVAINNVIGVQGRHGFTAWVLCGDAAMAGHIRYLLNFFKVHVPTTY
tara:strand:- start:562 stop:837 length:276 start_codon:yes stop_codon:yes gene_type:complete